MGAHYNIDTWEIWTAAMRRQFGNDGHGKSLSIEARRAGNRGSNLYAPAIRRWEKILGRPAPGILVAGVLNPAFVEWMMGYPDGYVVGVPGLNKSTALRALGNACVPQQAEAAVRLLLQRVA